MFWVKGATERERTRDTGTWFVLCCLVRRPKPVALCVFSLFMSLLFEWQMHNLYTQMHTYLNTQLRNLITYPSVSVVFFNALNRLPLSPCLTDSQAVTVSWMDLPWLMHDVCVSCLQRLVLSCLDLVKVTEEKLSDYKLLAFQLLLTPSFLKLGL